MNRPTQGPFESPDPLDLALVQAIQDGLPLCPRPYAEIADHLQITEAEVIQRVQRLMERGDIRRLGVVVRHRELGYRANAMVVWDVPDDKVSELGRRLGALPCVNLCYRRPRRLPQWRYNLFCMIHGRSREEVLENLQRLIDEQQLGHIVHSVLFSTRRYKQRGAHYGKDSLPQARHCPATPQVRLLG
ncbi:MAG: AsnC family transcriptional regulator [Gammaproteobacteria bacterium SHHR-1]|uniref:siroheme decarboxylase subunit beta n=1 Tax=Magnetovirga frankeli TaxID=947516 RepID=UPI001293961F|nr:AsnC family transcriptional regulator [gamma proteobacterium SS-5]